MKRMKRAAAVVCLALTLAFMTGCPQSEKLAGYASDVVEALNLSLPLLQQAGVNTGKIQTAITIGNQLVTAFKANQKDSAVDLTSKLITAFEGIVTDVNTIPMNQATRTRILVGLAVGQIALRIIARNLQSSAPAGVQDVTPISTMAAKKQWRCRSSVSGRFEKMDVCKKSPSTTTVETY